MSFLCCFSNIKKVINPREGILDVSTTGKPIEEILGRALNEPLVVSVIENFVESVAKPDETSTEPLIPIRRNSICEPLIDTSVEPLIETSCEPLIETSCEPLIETSVEPLIDTSCEPLIETSVEPLIDTSCEPTDETSCEPLIETSCEPTVETSDESNDEVVLEFVTKE